MTNQSNQISIHSSRDAANANATNGCKLIEVFKRNPTKYAGVWINCATIPATDDVPSVYRPIIDAIIIKTIKGIIDNHAFSGSYEPSWIPTDKLSGEAIITAMQQTGTVWLSKEEVAQGWEASATHQGFKAKMMALDAGSRKGYAKALGIFSDDINKLSAKSVKSIAPEQAEKMLAKLAEADLSTQWGEFIAKRLASIAAQEEPAVADIDGL